MARYTTPSTSSTTARPPLRLAPWRSPHQIFCTGSSRLELNKTGRRPTWNARSAMRAARFADRTDENVAIASTNVPPAVANDEIVTQSAIEVRLVNASVSKMGWSVDRGGSGLGVVIAARILALAGPREIPASNTAVSSATGAPVHFEPHGEHHLKGVPSTWPLFIIDHTRNRQTHNCRSALDLGAPSARTERHPDEGKEARQIGTSGTGDKRDVESSEGRRMTVRSRSFIGTWRGKCCRRSIP
jgi:hypothetical protein